MSPSHPATELPQQTPPEPGESAGVRRSFNEAAHKLGYWPGQLAAAQP